MEVEVEDWRSKTTWLDGIVFLYIRKGTMKKKKRKKSGSRAEIISGF